MMEHFQNEIAALRAQITLLRDSFGEEIRGLRWRLYHDRLTGLPNEAALHKHMDEKQGGWIVSIDLDGFKEAQDRATSHTLGNRILRSFARYLRRVTRQAGGRPHDFVAYRPHGDEFVVICATEEGAQRIAERVEAWRMGSVTASAGVGRTLDSADRIMYQRKAQKRPQV
ncbi:MAG: GGDEF domain-containing protein [Planctomycetota bacterium]